MHPFYFVFINFNDHLTTLNCIQSINQLSLSGTSVQMIVIDNDSQIDDYVALEKGIADFSNVKLIRSDKNLGYFGGLNLGISKIENPEKSFVIIGNNDLLFQPDFIQSVLNKKELFDAYPVISPNIITLDGTHQNPHVISHISRFREIIYNLYYTNYYLAILIKAIAELTKKFTDRKDELQHNIPQTIYQGYGACYILGPLFFKHFDNLLAPTFLMNEELFLSKQLKSKGFKLFYEPSIVIKHCLHATMSKIPGRKKWEIEKESHKTYRKYVKI